MYINNTPFLIRGTSLLLLIFKILLLLIPILLQPMLLIILLLLLLLPLLLRCCCCCCCCCCWDYYIPLMMNWRHFSPNLVKRLGGKKHHLRLLVLSSHALPHITLTCTEVPLLRCPGDVHERQMNSLINASSPSLLQNVAFEPLRHTPPVGARFLHGFFILLFSDTPLDSG